MPEPEQKPDTIERLNQHARELIREMNAEAMKVLGHPLLVAVEFRKDGEPIAYKNWVEIHRKIEGD